MAILIFVLVWIVLAVAVFWIGMGGGVRGARRSLYGQSRRARRTWAIALTPLYIVMAIVIPGLVIAAAAEHPRDQPGAKDLTAKQEEGREIFGEKCQQCHTLKAAGAVATVGPSFDQLRPKKALVLDAIEKGRARGNGRMPAAIVTGDDAEAVAEFVEATAGR